MAAWQASVLLGRVGRQEPQAYNLIVDGAPEGGADRRAYQG